MKVRVVGILALGLIVGVMGMGQVSQGSTAQFTVPTLIRLTVYPAIVDFGTLTDADFDAGRKDALNPQEVRVWSNRDWSLSVAATSATWTGPWAKPSTDLRWQVVAVDSRVTWYQGSWTALTLGATQAATGSRGGNIAVKFAFELLVDWAEDLPGDYTLGFTYTLTAP